MFFELAIASNFSFLRGASHPEELVVTAARLSLGGIALCDRNTVAGVVRAHMAAKEAGLRYQPGCRLTFTDGTPDCLVWPKDICGWNNLCRLLTAGNRRAPKGECHLVLADLLQWGGNCALALIPEPPFDGPSGSDKASAVRNALTRLKEAFGAELRLALASDYSPANARNMALIADIAKETAIPLLATNNVLYHRAGRRRLQDVVTCIREHVTLEKAGTLLAPNAERHLKGADEMARLFRNHPLALAETEKLFTSLSFSLDELQHQYPDETPENGLSPQRELARLAHEGAIRRYPPEQFPEGPPARIMGQISHELELIEQLEYAPYFLTVYDIVRFARSQNILCQGRGSAANSTVCYCLGITDVDPALTDLLFERFISPERKEPPDIDVDFEHERREEVIQYIYKKYGREHAGLAATVITYRARSAAREVGKVFGLSEDTISALSGSVWGHSSGGLGEREAKQGGLDVDDVTVSQVLELATEINGFPRHLSQHVGGFVITRDRLDAIIPVMNTAMEDRTQVEWDKDDLESLGILKIDILALGMLTCLRKCFDLLENHYDLPLTLASMEKKDKRTYAMIQRADTIGVFQIESRAQMSMLPRLRPENFYDLVIEVAIVRPGPIQGDMVHPYLRRRQGIEKVSYPSRELEEVLGRTLGVPLFQEQAMKIAIVAAGFSPGEADKLRRAMATFRRVGTIHTFQQKMVEGMKARGYDPEFAERCFRQIEGFGEYGFPESHAASFALLVYASCWLKCHYPDAFAAAILNSQPMGFYAPSQLVRDAREHGVEVLPPDINISGHDCTLEPGIGHQGKLHVRHRDMAGDIRSHHAVRLGLRMVKGVGETEAAQIAGNRGHGYNSVRELWLKTGLPRGTIEKLAEADAFRSIGLDRRAALWEVRALMKNAKTDTLPLFDAAERPEETKAGSGRDLQSDLQNEPPARLPQMPQSEHVIRDYRSLSLSLKAHPVSFLRADLAAMGVSETARLEKEPNGRRFEIAGLVVVRQRPGSAKGVVFMTLEDETGMANVIVWPKAFERFRAIVMSARLVRVRGKLQKADGVTHLVAEHLSDATPMLAAITEQGMFVEQMASSTNMTSANITFGDMGGIANADEVRRPIEDVRKIKNPKRKVLDLLRDQPELAADPAVPGSRPPDQSRMVAKRESDIGKTKRQAQTSRDLRLAAKAMPKGRNFH